MVVEHWVYKSEKFQDRNVVDFRKCERNRRVCGERRGSSELSEYHCEASLVGRVNKGEVQKYVIERT